jgi:hypothetical protein
MQCKSMKAVLAVVVCVAMLATGCTASWISVALADLPVLTQMALNIATLAAALNGNQPTPAEEAAIQSISNTAQTELSSLQALYNQYKANPDASTLQKIQSVMAEIQQQLPAQLQAVHISDAALSAKITAAVQLILTTVQSFAALLPASGVAPRAVAVAPRVVAKTASVPHASELESRWNAEVCGAGACKLK